MSSTGGPAEEAPELRLLKKEAIDLESSFKSDSHPLEAVHFVHDLLDQISPEDPRFEFFCTKFLPKSLHSLLSRSNYDANAVDSLLTFFKECTKFCTQFAANPLVVDSLRLLFSSDSKMKFFTHFKKDPERYDPDDDTKFQLDYTNDEWDVSDHMLSHVCIFIEGNGPDQIIDRIKATPKISLSVLADYVSLFERFYDVLYAEYTERYVSDLWHESTNFILNLTAAELKMEEKKHLVDIVHNFGKLLSRLYPPETDDQAKMMTEEFHLKVAFQWLKLPFIQKRVLGLTDINDFCSSILKPPAKRSERRVISQGRMEEMLDKERIVEFLFTGESSHPELTRRAGPVLKFLAFRQALNRDHLDMLWSAAIGKHETIKHQMWDLIGNLTQDLSLAAIEYVFKKIETIPPSDYDYEFIEFIRKVSESGIHQKAYWSDDPETQAQHWFGLDLLWKNLQDNVSHSAQNSASILQAFTALIEIPYCASERTTYIERCFENLKNFQSVPKSLQVLQAVIGSYSKDHTKHKIFPLLNERDLLGKFLTCIQKYAVFAQEASSSLPPETDINKYAFNGSDPYLSWFKTCLNFLEFLLCQLVPLKFLEPEHLDILWDATVTKALTEELKDTTFSWLENVLANKCQIMQESTMTHIFVNKVPATDLRTMSYATFSCFEYYFRYVNWKQSKFVQEKEIYRVLDFNLLGYDTLWKIVIEAENEKVGEKAIGLLNKLQTTNHPSLAPQLQSHRESFISRSISSLTEASQSFSESTPPTNLIYERRIHRCLDVLSKYIGLFEQNSRGHGGGGAAKALTFTIIPFFRGTTQAKFSLEMNDKQTVATLRTNVAEHLKLPIDGIRLVTAGTVLKEENDHQTIREAKVPLQIHVTKGVEGHQRKEQTASKQDSSMILPSAILAQDRYFEQIFQLLNLPSPMCLLVWDLLMKLPTNSSMKAKLKELSADTDWNSILDPRNVFRLYYCLQIVDALVHADGTKETEIQERDAWYSAFIKFGGVKHLNDILLTTDFFNSSCTKRLVCLGLLLENLNCFLLNEIQPGYPALKKDIFLSIQAGPEPVIAQLMSLISGVAIPEPKEAEALPSQPKGPSETEVIVTRSMQQLNSILLAEDAWVKIFLAQKDFSDWFRLVCVTSPVKQQRQAVCDGLFLACCVSADAKKQIYEMLLEMLPKFGTNVEDPVACVHSTLQYFELFSKLIQSRCEENPKEDFNSFMESILEMIQAQPIIEATSASLEHQTLMGLMKVAESLLKAFPAMRSTFGKQLFPEVFHKNLFDIPQSGQKGIFPPRCKTTTARQASFSLLLELVQSEENMEEFCQNALKLHLTQRGRQSDWDYQPERYDKAGSGFVGLENQGATCYMNSLVQQFFMHPHFKHRLLDVQDPAQDREQSILYQLQSIFVNLQESAMRFYNPLPFCKVYKVDGEPMRPDQQMDVDEFFSMLFDRLEWLLKPTPQAKMLDDLYGGQVVNQIISQDCDHRVERHEPFLTVSLEVKSKFTLAQSLDLYVQGDMLEGENKYHCSECDGKVTALKRTCIQKLPRNLIIHLKRFDFDVELLARSKINQFSDFPAKLNMEPYTKEGLARREGNQPAADPPNLEEYDYDLTGILVHSGTIDSGHYYSFIKDRETGRWFQFNDSNVTPFNPASIPSECYGGTYSTNRFDQQTKSWLPFTGWRHNNAYMLFYEQSHPAVPLPPPPKDLKVKENHPELYAQVWENNFKFLMDKNLFDKDYILFLEKVLDLIAANPQKENKFLENTIFKAAELGLTFFVQTLSHASEKSTLSPCAELLKKILSHHVPSCHWFIVSLTKNDWIEQLLTRCHLPAVSLEFCKLVAHAVSVLNQAQNVPDVQEESVTGEPVLIVNKSDNLGDASALFILPESKAPIPYFLGFLLKLTRKVMRNWRNFTYFWQLFNEIASISWQIRELMLNCGVLRGLAHIYLQQDSPWHIGPSGKKSKKDKSENDKVALANMRGIVSTLATLICGSRMERKEGVDVLNPGWNTSEHFLELSNPEDLKILEDAILLRLISDRNNSEAAVKIVEHMGWENITTSQRLMNLLHHGINKDDNLKIPAYWPAFVALTSINDSYEHERQKFCLERFVHVTTSNKKYPRVTSLSIYQLVEFVRRSAHVRTLFWKFHLNDLALWIVNVEEDSNKLRKEFEETRMAAELLAQELVPEIEGYVVSSADPEYIPTSTKAPVPSGVVTDASSKPLSFLIATLLPLLHQNAKLCQLDREGDKESSHFKLQSLLRVLNWCCVTDHLRTMFVEHIQPFMILYRMIDQAKVPGDYNKLCIVKLWDKLLDSPRILKLFVDREQTKSEVIGTWLSLPNELIPFNNELFPPFYSLMHKLIVACPIIREYTIKHSNFSEWALRYLYLESRDYQPVVPTLEAIIQLCLVHSPYFKQAWPQYLVQFGFPHQRLPKLFDRVFQNIIQVLRVETTPPLAIRFCEAQGLDCFYLCLIEVSSLSGPDLEILIDAITLATKWLGDPSLCTESTVKLRKKAFLESSRIVEKMVELVGFLLPEYPSIKLKIYQSFEQFQMICQDEEDPSALEIYKLIQDHLATLK